MSALQRLRAIALALPATAEKLSHDQPMFFVEKGRAFAHLWRDHHGDGETAVIVRTSGPDEQALLLEADPMLYYRPAYLGPAGWVAVRVAAADTDWGHVADRVAASWRLVAPRRLAAALG